MEVYLYYAVAGEYKLFRVVFYILYRIIDPIPNGC